MASQRVVFQVTYPPAAAPSFDMDYYLNSHIPLVQKRWSAHGLQSWSVFTGTEGSGYHVQATLIWKDLASFESAPHREEVMGDIKNFTEVLPTRALGLVAAQGQAA
ncbi:hypothetical protein BO71DRAFT_402635 [Aspergillus ellipticus CBS 707.79]|uniref:EthD domain-containing protein n=1 Tax=Aspergillus ellipticus CBS 707.79 TaxID=1448320 RepID=A0A319DG05_9EURO|nr:hypothetical protein BO71DRAFT_402635 [Aspergillus ellipticus CBS 707.79]